MLEKIGLPSKPSMKGGSWLTDASHCQGCASQFTFFNRKHHCRRCGGLFCGSCTSQKMYLRGQGDSAVRICDSCKKLEDAARFEMRHGSRTKASRGSTNSEAKIDENSLLREILGDDSKELPSSSSISSPSSVLLLEEKSVTVDSLRQQAIEEKQKYKALKREGKDKDALEAFKRARELERKANSLELAERKNRRKPAPSSDSPLIDDLKRGKRVARNGDDDILTELNKLGWNESEAKFPKPSSAEDEFSLILKETSKPRSSPYDRSEVIALKRAAVALKREGKLAEAKVELKKAKALEEKIAEEELLNAGDDSEDEISAMMRELGDSKEDEFTFDEPVLDENVDVTDADLIDPEMKAALESFGWTDEPEEEPKISIGLPKRRLPVQKNEPKNPIGFPKGRLAVQKELIAAKKKVLALKREGRVEEAEEELKNCEALEKQLAGESDAPITEDTFVKQPDADLIDPEMKAALESFGWTDEPEEQVPIQKEEAKNPVGRLAIQKALALRREGRAEEAEEEEEQKVNDDLTSDDVTEKETWREKVQASKKKALMLKREGKIEEAKEELRRARELEAAGKPEKSEETAPDKVAGREPEVTAMSGRERFKLQQEVLGLKRMAMKLRREGRAEEADTQFKLAKELEARLDETAPDQPPEGDVEVEDFMDAALVSALKEIGIEGMAPKKKADANEIWSLEEKIKEEKIKAVRLKRQGNVSEALQSLRNAKLLQNKLNDLPS